MMKTTTRRSTAISLACRRKEWVFPTMPAFILGHPVFRMQRFRWGRMLSISRYVCATSRNDLFRFCLRLAPQLFSRLLISAGLKWQAPVPEHRQHSNDETHPMVPLQHGMPGGCRSRQPRLRWSASSPCGRSLHPYLMRNDFIADQPTFRGCRIAGVVRPESVAEPDGHR